jgi:predicted NBD/HSP70 family sugar kinase/biotin operon repressor
MKNTPIDSKLAGQRNEQLILSLLREHGPLSQTQLCDMINLGSSTASSIVSRLRDKGLVIETRGQSDRRGPKPLLLKINPCAWYVVGIEINPSYIFMGLFDFTATLLDTRKLPLLTDHSVEHVQKVIEQTFPSLTALCGGDNGKLLGIGITVSGSISADGVVQMSSPLGWEQVPLKELMEHRLGRRVSVHSTRVRLMAEIAQKPQLQSRSILYLNVANGVGATVYMNGQLIPGATGRYGEIGHIIVEPDGPRCGCGHQGCLEAMISGRAIAERIRRDVNEGTKTIITEWMSRTGGKVPEEIVTLWGRAVGQQDSYAIKIRDFIAGYLSRAAAMSINVFDPDTVILAGYVCRQCPEHFSQSIRNAMSEQVYDSPRRDIRVMAACCGEEALITGVAMATLRDIFPV